MGRWFSVAPQDVVFGLSSLIIVYLAIIALTRLVGLRSFSKMSAADFAMTVAVGSLFSTIISSENPPLLLGLILMAGLFTGQWLLAYARKIAGRRVSNLVDNKPLLLVRDGHILSENLDSANVTTDDLMAKLREANAYNLDNVKAVVFETTGDISVLHGDKGSEIDDKVMESVQGW